MPNLLLGPLLRYVGNGSATIWVETDAACEVEILGFRERTFQVSGHHYALVVIRDLAPDSETAYEVHLDGQQVWPETTGELAAYPPSVIRAEHFRRPFRLAFGSCRVAYPLDDPEAGADALAALAQRLTTAPGPEWPDALLFVGDQVYADDNISPGAKAFVDSRRPRPDAPDGEINDFEEYTKLYQESWTPAPVRWLLSTVPSAMIFDDHDVRDDWNTSAAWRDEMRTLPWWHERITSGLMAYWVYQHLGNLAPEDLDKSQIYAAVKDAEDGAEKLSAYATEADAVADRPEGDHPDSDGAGGGSRWTYRRDLGTSRLLVLDSRAGRIVTGDKREMISESDWAWLEEQTAPGALDDVDHLLIATSVPFLLPPGVHHLESWNEAIAAGRWGKRFAGYGEQIRQAVDLEHWAAFGSSFERMADLLGKIGVEPNGDPYRAPATVTFLSGDVHFAYVARAHVTRAGATSPRIYQVVCSPLRNPLPKGLRYGQRFASSRTAHRIGRGVARLAGVKAGSLAWRIVGTPAFGNVLATIDLEGRAAVARIETVDVGPALKVAMEAELS